MQRPEAHRALRVSGFAAIGAGAIGAPQRYNWSTGGFVIGLLGTALGDGSLAGLSSIGIRIESNAQDLSMFGNDTGADYVVLATLHGNGLEPFPIMREVQMNEIWTVTARNYSAATAYTPEVTFHWRADAPPGWAPLARRR
jgi:hypothetical protein